MPLLDRSGERTDPWIVSDNAGDHTQVIVPLSALPSALETRKGNQMIGVSISNDDDLQSIIPLLGDLALIALTFPSFADGRAFSQARRLRRAGFAGQLRAVGPLIADQFAYAQACGFDEVELPAASYARQPLAQWQRAAGSMSSGYQRGYERNGSILEQRLAARRAGGGHV